MHAVVAGPTETQVLRLRAARFAQDDNFGGGLVAGEKDVDGSMSEGEQGPEGGGKALEALQRFLVAESAVFELGEAAGLTVADDFFHLGFEDGKVGEDGGFKVRHNL
jgi:hypothetical protein